MPARSFRQPPNRRPAPAAGPGQPLRVPVLGAVIALAWLTIAVLPATRPNQGGRSYFGAALIVVVAGAAIVMLTSYLRLRASRPGASMADALAPVLWLAIGSLVLGGLAYALHDPSPVLQDAFTWAAELGALATVVSLVPLPNSDGARALRIRLAKTRPQPVVEAAMARAVKGAGIAVIVVGLAVAGFLDLGLGILSIGLGWITLVSSRVSRAKASLDSALDRLSAADVVQAAQPIPGWRTLSEVLREQGAAGGSWPLGVSAVPVVDWSGSPAGVLPTAVAERALAAGRGDERVSALAIPAALVPSVDVEVPAQQVAQLLAGTAGSVAVVTRDGVAIGTVSVHDLQNASRTARLRQAAV